MVKRWIATSLAARLYARRNSGALCASLFPSAWASRRAAPPPRHEERQRKEERKRFDKRMAGYTHVRQGAKGKRRRGKTRARRNVGRTIGAEKKDERQERRWRARMRRLSMETEGERETEGPTGGTGGKNEKGWKKIERSIDRTPWDDWPLSHFSFLSSASSFPSSTWLSFLRFFFLFYFFDVQCVQCASQTENMSWFLAVLIVCFLVPTYVVQNASAWDRFLCWREIN